MPSARRVVVVTGAVPYDDVPHAGGRYVGRVVAHLRARPDVAEPTVVAASTPASREAAGRPGAPERLVLVDGATGRGVRARMLRRVVTVGDRWWRVLDPGMPPLPLAADLLLGGPLADAVASADVVDLQWSEQARLAGLVRRRAPRARVVGTFHDVQSQAFGRYRAPSAPGRLWWRLLTRRAAAHERRTVRRLDGVVVLSDKDAHLLGSPAGAVVVPPPLAPGRVVPHRVPDGPPVVLVVGHLARPENDEGVRWLLEHVWPSVADRVPGARLRIAGAGASSALVAAATARDDVALAGFVPDLAVEYDAATCAAVPVLAGAGVKFKAVEAIVRGVPVVTTSVGAEGIGDASWFAGVTDDAGRFADAVAAVLEVPEVATETAARTQELAGATYGPAAVAAALDRVLDGADADPPLR